MSTLLSEHTKVGPAGVIYPAGEPLAQSVAVDRRFIHVQLKDGRQISVPWDWFPRLRNATPAQRQAVVIEGQGDALHWEELDEDLSVRSLLRSGDEIAIDVARKVIEDAVRNALQKYEG